VDEETEARHLDRGLEALWDVAGVRPVGYRAPMWEPTWATPRLLAERGFLYDSSLMDADVPYELAVPGPGTRSIVEIPISWALDDWEQYCFLPGISGSGLIESPAKVREMWLLELDAMAEAEGCFVLTNHPFLTGRPSRAAALEAVISRAVEREDVWVASLEQIAEHVRGLGLSPRILEPPVLPD
jgi:peptidoglycan/xylan/chitin deacetylase (PgdA/CDA1 family)